MSILCCPVSRRLVAHRFPSTPYDSASLLDDGISHGIKSGLVSLRPGGSMHEHSTHDREELLICLHGRGEVRGFGGHARLKWSEVLYIPPNTMHSVHNLSSMLPMQYIYVVAPVAADR